MASRHGAICQAVADWIAANLAAITGGAGTVEKTHRPHKELEDDNALHFLVFPGDRDIDQAATRGTIEKQYTVFVAIGESVQLATSALRQAREDDLIGYAETFENLVHGQAMSNAVFIPSETPTTQPAFFEDWLRTANYFVQVIPLVYQEDVVIPR